MTSVDQLTKTGLVTAQVTTSTNGRLLLQAALLVSFALLAFGVVVIVGCLLTITTFV